MGLFFSQRFATSISNSKRAIRYMEKKQKNGAFVTTSQPQYHPPPLMPQWKPFMFEQTQLALARIWTQNSCLPLIRRQARPIPQELVDLSCRYSIATSSNLSAPGGNVANYVNSAVNAGLLDIYLGIKGLSWVFINLTQIK